jgi:hypothetical protein
MTSKPWRLKKSTSKVRQKDAGYTQGAGFLNQALHQHMAHALPAPVLGSGQCPDFGQVFPHDVERPAADDVAAVRLCDPELLQAFVVRHRLLGHQDPLLSERGYKLLDGGHVTGAGRPDMEGVSHRAILVRVLAWIAA